MTQPTHYEALGAQPQSIIQAGATLVYDWGVGGASEGGSVLPFVASYSQCACTCSGARLGPSGMYVEHHPIPVFYDAACAA